MTTKTVVCPECGAAPAPGRYACADCGALLAAVAAAPRSWGRSEDMPGDSTPVNDGQDVLVNRADIGPIELAEADVASVDRRRPTPAAEPGPATADGIAARAWPPVDAPGIESRPLPRVPAGRWLPPSAVLDGPDVVRAAGPPGSATSTAHAPAPGPASNRRSLSRTGVSGVLESFHLDDDAPRRVIAAGAGMAAVGFLLPWANVLTGAGLLGGYLSQWGLAGPGHWMVLLVLVGAAAVAAGGTRTASWPLGLGAVVVAALLVGLVWPYLFGVIGRSVGVWTVVAGALVLAAGGLLDRGRRHGAGPPSAE